MTVFALTADLWCAVVDTVILVWLVIWGTLDRLNVYWRRKP